jgi:outer membrane protein TolC
MKKYILVVACCLSLVAMKAQATEEQVEVPDLSGIEVLNLRTAQEIALAGNPDMVSAQARIEQARARVNQAVAAWWPSVDLTAVGQKERLSDSAYETSQALASLYGATADRTNDNFSTGLQATWLLFDGFFRNFNEKKARYDEEANISGLLNSQRLLVVSVAEAFLNAQLAQTNVDIAKADKAFYTRQLEDAQNRYDVGAGPWGDVLNIKVQLNSAETNLMLNQREFEAAGYGLAALLGIPDAAFPAHVRLEALDREFVTENFEENVEQLLQEALVARPDVRRQELNVKQAEAGTGLAEAPFYPTVQLAGAVNGARQGDVSVTGDDFGNSVSVNIAWNLFAGGADKARLAEAKQAKREARYALLNLRNQVASEIRQDIALLEAAQEQVRLQRETVGLVEENRDLAKNEYEAGEASLVRLNEAQRDLSTTYGRLAQALVGYHRALQRLDSATGRNLTGLVMEDGQE